LPTIAAQGAPKREQQKKKKKKKKKKTTACRPRKGWFVALLKNQQILAFVKNFLNRWGIQRRLREEFRKTGILATQSAPVWLFTAK